jgi:GTP pyrophosphokinase
MTGEPYIEHPVPSRHFAELGMDDRRSPPALLHDVGRLRVDFREMTRVSGLRWRSLWRRHQAEAHRLHQRRKKQAENLRKLFLAMAGDVRVIIIKLATACTICARSTRFPEQRKREIAPKRCTFSPRSRTAGHLAHQVGAEDRSSKYLEPEHYKQIYRWCSDTRASARDRAQRSRLAASVCARRNIRPKCTGGPSISTRSIRRCSSRACSSTPSRPHRAARHLPHVSDCYHALGVCIAVDARAGMFFDYIAKPKPNNYQSLHTKVLPSGDVVECRSAPANAPRGRVRHRRALRRSKDEER